MFPTRAKQILITVVLTMSLPRVTRGQESASAAADAVSAVVFYNVHLVTMDRERIETGQTVVVKGDRIVAIGPTGKISVPSGAIVIDGAGQYLLPGLTDAHVHITTDMPWAPARSEFGDGLLYLAHGVTSVVNLRGTATQLDWKRRIDAGTLLGPTIYTAGEFINEPRVLTPDDVLREVAEQARGGYDLVKFHEVWTPSSGFTTTTGLSREAYLRLFDVARERGLPVVGHAPVNLGIDALLASADGALAHAGELNRLYFLPDVRVFVGSVAALILLTLIVASWVLATVSRRLRGGTRGHTATLQRARALVAMALAVSVAADVALVFVFPGGLFFDSILLRLILTLLTLVLVVLAVILTGSAVAVWRDAGTRRTPCVMVAVATICVTMFTVAVGTHLVPVAWRSRPAGLEAVAERFRQAGVSLQSTLIVYDILATDTRNVALRDPSFGWLSARARSIWRRQATRGIAESALIATLIPRYSEFAQRIVGAMQRHGVLVLAGTDAMGIPFTIPGWSLQRELELLAASGLTPYEAIRSATVNPATFLRKDAEFGSIVVGKRADLLLVAGNPLQNLQVLRQPIGIMVRGRWLPREHLQQMLTALSPN